MSDLFSSAKLTIKTHRRIGSTSITVAGVLLASGLLTVGLLSLPDNPAVAGVEDTSPAGPIVSNVEESQWPAGSEIISLDLTAAEPGAPFEVVATIAAINGGQPITLEFWPHSVRDLDFRVWEQIDDGSLVEIDPGVERTLRGQIVDMPGSMLAGSLFGIGLVTLIVLPDGGEFWIEPIAGGLHIVYDADDADCDGICGVPQRWMDHIRDGDDGGLPLNQDCKVAKIAFDADFQFYTWQGSNSNNVINYINNIVNSINGNQYENQVGIIHEITEIVIRTSQAANPYTSCSANTLLNQFRNVWRTAPESSIPRNMAHLMTGCNMGNILGIAWLGSVCDSIHGHHYAVSRNMGQWACQTDLVAHETGHNWNAGHCGCPSSTMNASITCANTFTGGGSNSVNQILNFKNSVNCLTPCDTGPPDNNTCANSLMVGEGNTPFTNVSATTDGPSETLCNFSGNSQVQSDVWFRHTTQCTGTLHVRLCNTSPAFDTKLAVYGAVCPSSPDTAIACNKDSCGQLSALAVPVVAGQTYRIRVGGHGNAQGEGILTVFCSPDPDPDPCPADLTGNGSVGVPDLLELLSQWGPCGDPDDCPADLTGNGSVGVPDLLELLSQWGPCP